MKKILKKIKYIFISSFCVVSLACCAKIEAKAYFALYPSQEINYLEDATFNSVVVPHGKHYELLTNDTQRKLYDAMYRASLPQYIGTYNKSNAYKFDEISIDKEKPERADIINERDEDLAEDALKYDNPGKIEYTLSQFGYTWKKNSDGNYNIYAIVVPDENYADYSSINARLESQMNAIVETVKKAGYVDFSTEESTAISLFKLSFFFAPHEPLDKENIPVWHGTTYHLNTNMNYDFESSAYGIVCNKVGCCVGFSKAYAYLLNKLGFNDVLIEDCGNHVVNLVKIGNDWYDVDVTNSGGEMGCFGQDGGKYKDYDLKYNLLSGLTPTPVEDGKYAGYRVYDLMYYKHQNETNNSSSDNADNNASSENSSTHDNTSTGGDGSVPSDASHVPTTPADTTTVTPTTQDVQNIEPVTKEAQTLTTLAQAPKKLSVKSTKRALTVKWKKQTKNTSGYEIQYSTDKNFKNGTKSVSVKKSATNKTIKKLKSGKVYYVRIRTKYNGMYSEWSKTKKVKVK